MKLSTALFSLCFVAVAACGGTTSDTTSGSSGSSGSTPTPSSPNGSAVVGIYHLDQVDATNLEIRSDGSYQWSIEGCDFGGGQCGTWKSNAEGVLALESGSAPVEWSYGGSFRAELTRLAVKKDGDDVLVLGETKDGKSFEQSWKKGRSCALCGGQLGPTGQEACSTPLPKICKGG